MGGIGSGAQKKPSTLLREAKDKDAKNLDKYFNVLSDIALNGDRDALQYLIDRHLGKPKQQTDIDLTGADKLGAGVVSKLFQILAEERKRLTEGLQ